MMVSPPSAVTMSRSNHATHLRDAFGRALHIVEKTHQLDGRLRQRLANIVVTMDEAAPKIDADALAQGAVAEFLVKTRPPALRG